MCLPPCGEEPALSTPACCRRLASYLASCTNWKSAAGEGSEEGCFENCAVLPAAAGWVAEHCLLWREVKDTAGAYSQLPPSFLQRHDNSS